MGISEFIAALGAVGLSSVILALVKLFQFFRESNSKKVDDILTRVNDDNKRWHTKYEKTFEALEESRAELAKSQILVYRYKLELMTNGIPEDRIETIEKEAGK